jgi:hypothetical protein
VHSHALNATAQQQHQEHQQNNALHTAPHFFRPADNHLQREEAAAAADKENGNNRANPFAANAFNLVSFYEEEEDDEDNRQDGDTPDQFNWDDSSQLEGEPLREPALLNHLKEAPHTARTSSQSLKQPCASNATANEATAPGKQACTSNATNEAPVCDGALSTLELLQLFCCECPQALIFTQGRPQTTNMLLV